MPDSQLPRIFIRTSEKERVPYFAAPPIVAGGGNGTYAFERRAVEPGSLAAHSFDSHVLMLSVGKEPVRFSSRLNGRPVSGYIEPGRFRFLSQGDTLATSWNAPIQGLFLTLPPALFARTLDENRHDRPLQLVSRLMPHEDPLLNHLLHAVQAYTRGQRLGGRLFEQSLMSAVAAHVTTTYGSGRRDFIRGPHLPRWKHQRLLQFVEEHLGSDLDLDRLAIAMNTSPYHLARAFRATTGQSLWQFVLECRAKEAHRLITAYPDLPLSEIANACGFESYSQFIAAFRKFYALLPSEFRRSL